MRVDVMSTSAPVVTLDGHKLSVRAFSDAVVKAFASSIPVQIVVEAWKRPSVEAMMAAIIEASGAAGEWTVVEKAASVEARNVPAVAGPRDASVHQSQNVSYSTSDFAADLANLAKIADVLAPQVENIDDVRFTEEDEVRFAEQLSLTQPPATVEDDGVEQAGERQPESVSPWVAHGSLGLTDQDTGEQLARTTDAVHDDEVVSSSEPPDATWGADEEPPAPDGDEAADYEPTPGTVWEAFAMAYTAPMSSSSHTSPDVEPETGAVDDASKLHGDVADPQAADAQPAAGEFTHLDTPEAEQTFDPGDGADTAEAAGHLEVDATHEAVATHNPSDGTPGAPDTSSEHDRDAVGAGSTLDEDASRAPAIQPVVVQQVLVQPVVGPREGQPARAQAADPRASFDTNIDEHRAAIGTDPMLDAAYALLAFQQPRMVSGLTRRPDRIDTSTATLTATDVSSLDLLRELADIDDLL